MKDLQNGIEKVELDDAAEMKRVLGKQRYPYEANVHLYMMAKEYQLPLDQVTKVFCLGMIFGKRDVRRKRKT